VGTLATNRNALTASKGRSVHSLYEISTTIPMIVRSLALNSYELLSLKTASYRIDTVNADGAREGGRSDFANKRAGVDGPIEHLGRCFGAGRDTDDEFAAVQRLTS
jgi:hypothetical protein